MSSAFHHRLENALLGILTIVAVPVMLLSILLESGYHHPFLLISAIIIAVAVIL